MILTLQPKVREIYKKILNFSVAFVNPTAKQVEMGRSSCSDGWHHRPAVYCACVGALVFTGQVSNVLASVHWCSQARPDITRNQILTDPHTPRKYRVIGTLQNSQAGTSLACFPCFWCRIQQDPTRF